MAGGSFWGKPLVFCFFFALLASVISNWVFPKIGVPPNHPYFNRVFHYFHHPFWGMPIFGNTHLYPNYQLGGGFKYLLFSSLMGCTWWNFRKIAPETHMVRTWKWMVGILSRFLLGFCLFSGAIKLFVLGEGLLTVEYPNYQRCTLQRPHRGKSIWTMNDLKW